MWGVFLRTLVLAAFLAITVAGFAGELRLVQWGSVWILDRPLTMDELVLRMGSLPDARRQDGHEKYDDREAVARNHVHDPRWSIRAAAGD